MKKLLSWILLGCSSLAVVAISLSAISLGWFTGPKANVDKQVINGEVGLRGYFYDGDGLSPATAFEIVAPRHYYNLTRLQNLGIFPEKRYFQLGHDFGGDIGIACRNTDEHGEPTYDKYLDLADLSTDNIILPIGSEGTPFYGTFEGNGLSLRNLTVKGYPEDIGVFGYVAHEGSVNGLVCEQLTVESLGYTNSSSSPEYDLFDANISNVFAADVDEISSLMKLEFYDGVGNNQTIHDLKHLNGTSGTALEHINSQAKLFDESYIYKGYFVPTYPNRANEKFTYSWKSSSPIIRDVSVDVDGDGTSESIIAIDLEPLAESTGTEESFNSGDEMEADARISLVASVDVDGYEYSRVIQSYKVEFYSNSTTYEEGGYSCAIFCDYVDQGVEHDHNTNYHHGNNIGLLAGHVDGSFTNSYVYKGNLKFNKTDYTPIDAETDTALIGEIGVNVQNDLDPEIQLTKDGDTGVMNFSKIYSMIRDDMSVTSPPKTLLAGQATPLLEGSSKNYIEYTPFKNTETFDNFKEFLRRDYPASGEPHYLIGTGKDMSSYTSSGFTLDSESKINWDFNQVDFIYNKLIQDEIDEENPENSIDRGLGVFKIVTGKFDKIYQDPDPSKYVLNKLSSSRILNSDEKTKVYFSTAEFDHIKGAGSEFEPNRGVSLPEYSDINSFGWQFERDFNYCFELDLAQMEDSGGRNYMWNTDSPFLINYLKSKLIDKIGNPVSYLSKKFGFMFRSSENETLDNLSSYMPLGVPSSDTKQAFTVNGETKYYPESCIAFSIKNDFGANVSVVGNGQDISIYSNNPDIPGGSVTKLYSMKSSQQTGTDQFRYFTYDVVTGATGTEAVINPNMTSNDAKTLYAHIFKLPKGDYVIGARSGTANLYFLAVQGQNDATLGDKNLTYIGSAIKGVDFILEAPSNSNVYPFEQTQAMFTFKSVFNLKPGDLSITVVEEGGNKYMGLNFVDTTAQRFVMYLFLFSRHPDHTYFVNGQKITTTPTMYPRE